MTRDEFLAAVSAAWTYASGDPWALASHAEAFADHVDRANGSRPGPLAYGQAVVIDGDRLAVVCSAYAYKLDPATFEGAAGEVTSVMRGSDLLAGHIGDRPRAPKPAF